MGSQLKIVFALLCGLLGPLLAETVAIVTVKNTEKPWDPESIQTGIAGSEEAVIYMSQSLAKLGYSVTVLANPPAHSVHSLPTANPRFLPLDMSHLPQFDIAIAWRHPFLGPSLKQRAKKVYLWPHDTWDSPLPAEVIQAYDGVLWLSEWQRQQWARANPALAKFKPVFGNGVLLEQFHAVQPRENPYSCIYGSNYGRGLEILLDGWPEIKKRFPKATLDIYYGWQHWGILPPKTEAKMRAQIVTLAPYGVTDHGLVGHAELNRAYERASFWTYPCTADETFCITALRAQFAGAIPVVLMGSALIETVQSGYRCREPKDYIKTLIQALETAEGHSVEERQGMGQFISRKYSWDAIAVRWKELFQ